MKKALLIALITVAGYGLQAQSLTLKDLVKMTSLKKADQFLAVKGFTRSDSTDNPAFFEKKIDSAHIERITFEGAKRSVSYQTQDTAYIKKMVVEVKKSFHLLIKHVSEVQWFYEFGNDDMDILAMINADSRAFGNITISSKKAKR